MDDQHLKQLLTQRAEQEIPETMDIRQKVFRQINAPARFSWRASRLQWRWAAVIAALIVFSSGAVYALWQGGLTPDPGIQKVQDRIVPIGQTQQMEASEPLRSLAITVDYAYADSNRVTVGYHVNGSAIAGTSVELFSNPLLTDDAGRAYMWLPTSGQQVITAQQGADEAFSHEGIMSFDAAVVTDNPGALNLALVVQTAYTTAETRAADPFGMLGAGEARFAFSVPFVAGKTAAVGQSASDANLTIDVQQVVIAPSLTRVELCLSDAGPFAVDAWTSWEALVTLDVNGQRVLTDLPSGFAGAQGAPLNPSSTCRALTIPDALTQHTGAWTLTLNGFRNRESGQQVAGAWSFTFNVD